MKSVPIEVAESSADICFYCSHCLSSQMCDVTIVSTNDVILGVGLLKVAVRGSV